MNGWQTAKRGAIRVLGKHVARSATSRRARTMRPGGRRSRSSRAEVAIDLFQPPLEGSVRPDADRWGKVHRSVIADPTLTGTELRVYCCLATYANAKTGAAWPAQATLARVLGLSRQTVNKAAKTLALRGLVRKHRRRGYNGKRPTLLYVLTLVERDARVAAGVDASVSPPVATRTDQRNRDREEPLRRSAIPVRASALADAVRQASRYDTFAEEERRTGVPSLLNSALDQLLVLGRRELSPHQIVTITSASREKHPADAFAQTAAQIAALANQLGSRRGRSDT